MTTAFVMPTTLTPSMRARATPLSGPDGVKPRWCGGVARRPSRRTEPRCEAGEVGKASEPLSSVETAAATAAAYKNAMASRIEPADTDALLARLRAQPPASLTTRDLALAISYLADGRGMARLALVDLLGAVGARATPLLLSALREDGNAVVRRSCGKALAKIADVDAVDTLLHVLTTDMDFITRSSAAGALARMGAPAVPRLLALIADERVEDTAKGHAAWAVAFMQHSAGDALFDAVASANQQVRLAVVQALGGMAIGDALPVMPGLSSMADDDDWSDGELGAEDASRATARDRALRALRNALRDTAGDVRAEAATALGNARDTGDAPAVAKLLADDDDEVRRCAALSLLKLGDVAFVPALDGVADDEHEVPHVRRVAALAADTLRRRMADGGGDDDYDD